MPKSKPKPNKYANKAPQVFENGFAVTLGGADEIAHHYRRHFHQFLDYLTINPSAPNLLDQVGRMVLPRILITCSISKRSPSTTLMSRLAGI